jgi:polyferredoxin
MLAVLGRKIFRRSFALPRWLDLPLRSLQYLLLGFFAWAVLRMTPLMLAGFLDSPYNKVADVAMLRFFLHLSGFALGVLAVLAVASLVVPHFWCRYLCPYGALLGLTSLVSPFKVTRSPASCIDCGLCARACPAHLPVDRLARVRSAQCTGCLSCIAACPVESALRVAGPPLPGRGRPHLRPALAALLLLALFFGGIAWARWSGHWRSSVSDAEYGVRLHEMDQPEYAHAQ